MNCRRSLACLCELIVGILAFAAVVVVFATAALAQTGLPFSSVPAGGMGNAPGISFPVSGGVPVRFAGRGERGFRHGLGRFGTVPPIFFGAGDYYGSDFYGSGEPGSVVINNIVPAPEAKVPAVQEQPPAAPLVIELEGNKWVRRRLASTAPGEKTSQTESEPQLLPAHAPQPLPDTTLVFRDGHRENVSTYMIFGGALYHSTPAWAPQRQVKLSQLNLPATEEINRKRGVVFRLPSSPNEVVTRP